MSILGNRVFRREDPKLLTAGGTYVGDLELPGALTLSFVRSSIAHGRIVGVDIAEAKAAPGVVAVYLNEDVGLAMVPEMGMLNPDMTRPPWPRASSASWASPSPSSWRTRRRPPPTPPSW